METLIHLNSTPTASHIGPPIEKGPLPTVIYFALTGDESLTKDPYNQPIVPLWKRGFRTLSFTLPGHGDGLDPKEGMKRWSEALSKDSHYLTKFVTSCIEATTELIHQEIIDPNRLAVAGLSRGAYIASLFAANFPAKALLGFAPLTTLSHLVEFPFEAGSISSYADRLLLPIRYYIGNRDQKVETETCFKTIQSMTEAAYAKGIRSPAVELIIHPSIGYKGHGTPPEIFQAGSEWVSQILTGF